jgi:hypothetical protein
MGTFTVEHDEMRARETQEHLEINQPTPSQQFTVLLNDDLVSTSGQGVFEGHDHRYVVL